MAGDGLGQGRFTGAVWAHDGMDFALIDGKGQALDDGLVADGDVKILDDELAHWRKEGKGVR